MPNTALLQPLLDLSDARAAEERRPGATELHELILTSESYVAFAQAAAAECPNLGRLMTGATLQVAHELGGYEVTTPNGAWVIARLLDDGIRLATAEGGSGREAVHHSLARVLDGVIDALTTGKSSINLYVGLRGLSLGEMDHAEVGVGELRYLAPEEIRSWQSDVGLPPPLEHELCLVLNDQATWTVRDEAVPGEVSAPHAQGTLSRLNLFPVLMTLAGARDRQGRVRAPHTVWTRPSPYFFRGGAGGGGANPNLQWRTGSFYDGIVTPAVAEEARRLLPPLLDAPAESIRVTTHRLASAALVYDQTHEDRLVNAAVAWEALFGSGSYDQLSLQLALSIAWLLAPNDFQERERIYRRAKKIYGLRSKLVHGGGANAPDVETAADELTDWLRRAVVALVTTHTPLLAVSDRVQRLLLQHPGNVTPGDA